MYYFPTVCISTAHSLELDSWAWKWDWPHPNTKYFKPKQHQMSTLNFLPHKFSPKLFLTANTVLTDTIKWEISLGLTRACQIQPGPVGFANLVPPLLSLHFPLPTESHHYCQSSWALAGSAYGHGTELDWIGQWSHCKCITLMLPILQSYLHTESHYYCRGVSVCRAQNTYACMY